MQRKPYLLSAVVGLALVLAGAYLVDGGSLKGYVDPGPSKIELKAGATVKKELAYQKVIPSTGPPDKLVIVKVVDAGGQGSGAL